MATTSPALGSKRQKSSRCSSASLPISPPVSNHRNSMELDETWLTFPEVHGDPLLPGIPNDITFAHLVPKLTWRDFYVLARVSRAWCHAIRSRQVYDARVRCRSTETLVLIGYEFPKTSITLYSMKEDFCFELPPIPELLFSGFERCLAADGKIYILRLSGNRKYDAYVFDLAAQRHWQNCTALETVSYENLHWSEWEVQDATVDLYHPLTNEVDNFHWKSFQCRKGEALFMAQGRLHQMTSEYVQDFDDKDWTHLHSFSFDGIRPADEYWTYPLVVLSVDDELLAIVESCGEDYRNDALLIRCKGFRGGKEELFWQKCQIPPAVWPESFRRILSPVQV